MVWNKQNNINLYVRCEYDDTRTAYRIEPDDHSSTITLLIDGERVKINNISANGIAFETCANAAPLPASVTKLHGILFLGPEHHPIPVELIVIARQERMVRCKISNQNLTAQKKLTKAISDHQKQKIRAREHAKKPE